MSDQNPTNSPPGSPPENTPVELPQLPLPIQIDDIWRECEAKLKILRSDVEQMMTNSAATGQPISFLDQARIQQVKDILSSLTKDPFALIKKGVQDAQHDAQTPPASDSTPANPDGSSSKPADAEDKKVTAPVSSNLDSLQNETQQVQAATQDIAAGTMTPVPPATAPDSASPDLSLPAFSFAETGGDTSTILGAQAAQASGERMRAALEQNTQTTASLFDEMLALLDGQNRKLGEVDRIISELNGQLNSLKNP